MIISQLKEHKSERTRFQLITNHALVIHLQCQSYPVHFLIDHFDCARLKEVVVWEQNSWMAQRKLINAAIKEFVNHYPANQPIEARHSNQIFEFPSWIHVQLTRMSSFRYSSPWQSKETFLLLEPLQFPHNFYLLVPLHNLPSSPLPFDSFS